MDAQSRGEVDLMVLLRVDGVACRGEVAVEDALCRGNEVEPGYRC